MRKPKLYYNGREVKDRFDELARRENFSLADIVMRPFRELSQWLQEVKAERIVKRAVLEAALWETRVSEQKLWAYSMNETIGKNVDSKLVKNIITESLARDPSRIGLYPAGQDKYGPLFITKHEQKLEKWAMTHIRGLTRQKRHKLKEKHVKNAMTKNGAISPEDQNLVQALTSKSGLGTVDAGTNQKVLKATVDAYKRSGYTVVAAAADATSSRKLGENLGVWSRVSAKLTSDVCPTPRWEAFKQVRRLSHRSVFDVLSAFHKLRKPKARFNKKTVLVLDHKSLAECWRLALKVRAAGGKLILTGEVTERVIARNQEFEKVKERKERSL